jgi:hypothetical protein
MDRTVLAASIESRFGLSAAEAGCLVCGAAANRIGGIEGVQKQAIVLAVRSNVSLVRVGTLSFVREVCEAYPALLKGGAR